MKLLIVLFLYPSFLWALNHSNDKMWSPASTEYDIESLISDAKNSQSVNELISKLPEKMRSEFTLVHSSESLQGSSFMSPRVIMMNVEEDLVATFNGEASQAGYASLEVSSFDRVNKRVQFREITFKKDLKEIEKNKYIPLAEEDIFYEDNKVIISKSNPVKCMACHGTPIGYYPKKHTDRFARYIWADYHRWPRAYGMNDDFIEIDDFESEYYKFLRIKDNNERYSQLIFDSAGLYCDFYSRSFPERSAKRNCRQNLKLTHLAGSGQMIQVASYISEKLDFKHVLNYLNYEFGCPNKSLNVEPFKIGFSEFDSLQDLFRLPNSFWHPFVLRTENTSKIWRMGFGAFPYFVRDIYNRSGRYSFSLRAHMPINLIQELGQSGDEDFKSLSRKFRQIAISERPDYMSDSTYYGRSLVSSKNLRYIFPVVTVRDRKVEYEAYSKICNIVSKKIRALNNVTK